MITKCFSKYLAVVTAALASTTSAFAVTFVDWTSASPGSVQGAVTGPSGLTSNVTYLGEVYSGTVIDNTFTGVEGLMGWAEPYYTPGILTPSDIITLTSAVSPTAVTFSLPVVHPVFHVFSLGRGGLNATVAWNFSAPFTILSSGSEYGPSWPGLSNPSGNILQSLEGSGSIQFQGTFSQITWTTSGSEPYQGIHVGVVDVVPEPGTASLFLLGASFVSFHRRFRGNRNA